MTDRQLASVWLADEEATLTAGRVLAAAVRQNGGGGLVFLRGDLGAGKTTLSRGFIRALGHVGAVKSPTYTLVEPYEHLQPPAWHFDLYRLGDPEELEFMGIRDYFSSGNLCLIEWPERGQGLLPVPDLELRLVNEGAGRRLTLVTGTAVGNRLLEILVQDGGLVLEPVNADDKTENRK